MVDRLSSRLQRKHTLTPGDAKRQAEILARVVTRNASELPLRLSRQLRHHAFMLVHNALPTRWRDRHLPHTLPGTPCALSRDLLPPLLGVLCLCRCRSMAPHLT